MQRVSSTRATAVHTVRLAPDEGLPAYLVMVAVVWWLAVAPPSSTTVSVTVKVPVRLYLWVGLAAVEVEPSPKSQR